MTVATALKTVDKAEAARRREPLIHVYGNRVVCETDSRGHATPKARSLTEIVVDASEGFIPLWSHDTILRWRFQEQSLSVFEDPQAVRADVRLLVGHALLAWGDAVPIKFAEREDAWDFEIVVEESPRCTLAGCVLASAFFPDAGRHELKIYPTMFEQSPEEQIETVVHELGHVFGLRHFFAKIRESEWASEIFGTHEATSIMNYGPDSKLTDTDRSDLKKLYRYAWSGKLTNINGTPIRFVKPFSSLRSSASPELIATIERP